MGDCVHHWELEQPRDGATPGVCRDCGAERTFSGGVTGALRERLTENERKLVLNFGTFGVGRTYEHRRALEARRASP